MRIQILAWAHSSVASLIDIIHEFFLSSMLSSVLSDFHLCTRDEARYKQAMSTWFTWEQ